MFSLFFVGSFRALLLSDGPNCANPSQLAFKHICPWPTQYPQRIDCLSPTLKPTFHKARFVPNLQTSKSTDPYEMA